MISAVSAFLLLVIICGCKTNFGNAADSYEPLVRVRSGKGVSILDLWNCQGYITDYNFDIFRSGIIDLPFTSRCPSQLHVTFTDSNYYSLISIYYNEPFQSNSIYWMTSAASWIIPTDIPFHSFQIDIKQNEDVILKAYTVQDPTFLYGVVYFPNSSLVGYSNYPKYYVTNTTTPVFGKIPGDEHLFREAGAIELGGIYNDVCNFTTSGVTMALQDVKDACKPTSTSSNSNTETNNSNRNETESCDNSTRQGTFYKQSAIEHHKQTNAVASWILQTGTVIPCATMCSLDKNACKSFFFTPGTGNCIGLNHIEDALDKPANAIHYIPVNDNCN